MNVLIVGGTSGLGLELAKIFKEKNQVFVTGRTDPKMEGALFVLLDLNSKNVSEAIHKIVRGLPKIDVLVYAAGFYQEGKIDELKDEDIIAMDNVGLRVPVFIVQSIMQKQKGMEGFIAITSTSQFTPRLLEPLYTAVKAGLAMFAQSIAEDERIKKTLVVAPAGMQTKFWEGRNKDTSAYLDPAWVAESIFTHYNDDFRFKEIHLLRESPRVELVAKK